MSLSGCVRNFFLPASLLAAMTVVPVYGQIKPPVGIRQNTPAVHALTNAKIIFAPGRSIEKGTIIIRDGTITDVGSGVAIPPDARVWDMSGSTLYPGFIDGYSDLGLPKKAPPPAGDAPVPQRPAEQQRGVHHWNQNVLSSANADQLFVPDQKTAEKLRSAGISAALLVPQAGIFRGTSALVLTGDGSPNELLVRPRIAQHIAFESSSDDSYPNSLMGAIALVRQTFLDAKWYQSARSAVPKNSSEKAPGAEPDLTALADAAAGKQPVIFETAGEIDCLRVSRIAEEFGLKAIIRGSGSEYRRLSAIKKTRLPVVLPVNFPDPPAVQTPEDALAVGIEELRLWDEAPENPKRLHDAGIPFVFTSTLLKDPANFLPNIRKAVERGLPRDAALEALTTGPAALFGMETRLGSLERGKIANIVVTDGDLFAEKTKIQELWVGGKRYEVKPRPEFDARGTWSLALAGAPVESCTVVLSGDPDALQGSVRVKGKDTKLGTAAFSDRRLSLSFTGDSVGLNGIVRMSADLIDKALIGWGELASGTAFRWNAVRGEPFKPGPDTTKPKSPQPASFSPLYPPVSFGRPELPVQPEHILVRNATIWTCSAGGVQPGSDLLIERGKILSIGKQLKAPSDAVVIDATGKQVTPGIIDCHSHTAISGSVNEVGKTITAEVRIGDVIDPDDISIYRELAGGLTVANVLHGSANPIGGQSQVIKLRWGALPEEMKFEGAPPGIKFALGENPKQSNWDSPGPPRYPRTRQGVDQIIRDEFRAARDYEQALKEFHDGKTGIPPRRNLQSEAVLEVLRGQRIVHAHAYRQDEIEMLMRVAEDFGFRVATFQHALESYKVADQLARHGAGASMFSDWWAYKMEVYDAIPYNGVLTHDAGVTVSYNSDSDELARHLTTEAGKAVKYGGLSETEALKFVTINPARQLRIDGRVGSLEPGKDADFVIWNGDPLSTMTICEQTWIDGRRYFDRDEDRIMNDAIASQRAVLVQKALVAKGTSGGASAARPAREPYSCHEELSEREGR